MSGSFVPILKVLELKRGRLEQEIALYNKAIAGLKQQRVELVPLESTNHGENQVENMPILTKWDGWRAQKRTIIDREIGVILKKITDLENKYQTLLVQRDAIMIDHKKFIQQLKIDKQSNASQQRLSLWALRSR